jgi:glycosyltransferase involved in cell wall biosynthesis
MTFSPARQVDVSVLVPAKDEVENLPEFARLCDEALRGAPFTVEVIVVDDGSRDDSAQVLKELAERRASAMPRWTRCCTTRRKG